MTAIEGLLRKAIELNEAGIREFGPAINEMAAVQSSMSAALAPLLESISGVSGAEPVRYGFTLPAEPPPVKAEAAEGPKEKVDVSLGPINVYTIAREIQKALDDVSRQSVDVPALYSTYAAPAALPVAPAALPDFAGYGGERPPASAPRDIVTTGTPSSEMAGVARRKETAEEWVEKSVRRSSVVMTDLKEIHKDIVEKTITAKKAAPDTLAIGPALAAGHEALRPPETTIGPSLTDRPAPSFTRPADVERNVHLMTPASPPERKAPEFSPMSGPSGANKPPVAAAPPGPGSKKEPLAVKNVVEAPPIRPWLAPPAEEAAFNAKRLAGALSATESGRAPDLVNKPVDAPAERPRMMPQAPPSREARPAEALTPMAQAARSLGWMGEYMRAAAEISRAAGLEEAGITNTGQSLMNTGQSLMNTGQSLAAAMAFPVPLSPPAAPPLPVPDGTPPSRPAYPGTLQAGSPPVMRLTASVAAAQASQRSGMAAIRELISSVPVVAGDLAPPPAAIHDVARGLSFAAPISPAAASGAESIVNVAAPPSAPGRVSENNTTNKVSNFHNTFNITVNVRGGEERDIKDLGRKIGQILSDEIKRYGGI